MTLMIIMILTIIMQYVEHKNVLFCSTFNIISSLFNRCFDCNSYLMVFYFLFLILRVALIVPGFCADCACSFCPFNTTFLS